MLLPLPSPCSGPIGASRLSPRSPAHGTAGHRPGAGRRISLEPQCIQGARSWDSGRTTAPNTRDFKCLRHSGLLPLWCSVLVFESGFAVPLPECGHGSVPRVAAGMARGSTARGPGGRGGFSFLAGSGCGRDSGEAGREYDDLRFTGNGLLGRGGVPKFRPSNRARFEWRCRAGTFRVCRAARAAASPAAAIASRDDVAVSWEGVRSSGSRDARRR